MVNAKDLDEHGLGVVLSHDAGIRELRNDRAPSVLSALDSGGAEDVADEVGRVQVVRLLELSSVEALLHLLQQVSCLIVRSHRRAGTVHRHFPTKEALFLAVATDQIQELVAEAKELSVSEDPGSAFSKMLSRMITTGAGELKSALAGAEFDLRTAAPVVAADLMRHVGVVLSRAQSVAAVRQDLTIEELMALVAGTLAAIRHANAETDRERTAHLAQIMFDGLRPNPPRQ
jgi:hypothetical protein